MREFVIFSKRENESERINKCVCECECESVCVCVCVCLKESQGNWPEYGFVSGRERNGRREPFSTEPSVGPEKMFLRSKNRRKEESNETKKWKRPLLFEEKSQKEMLKKTLKDDVETQCIENTKDIKVIDNCYH